MASLIISEQDMINSICLYMSHEEEVEPDQVEVELIYDDEANMAFSAEVTIKHKTEEIPTVKIIAALRLWLNLYTDMNGISAGLKLHFDEVEEVFYASAW